MWYYEAYKVTYNPHHTTQGGNFQLMSEPLRCDAIGHTGNVWRHTGPA